MAWFAGCVLLPMLARYLCVTGAPTHDLYAGSDFAEMLRESVVRKFPIVDKTLLIRDLVANVSEFLIVTRPRKWGKSLNMDMIHRFLNIEVDGEGDELKPEVKIYAPVFNEGSFEYPGNVGGQYPKLEIADYDEIMREQGKHVVLKMDFSQIELNCNETITMETLRVAFSKYISRLVNEEYGYLVKNADRMKLRAHGVGYFRNYVNGNATLNEYMEFLTIMKNALRTFHNATSIFVLIDEYDAISNTACLRGSSDSRTVAEVVDFFGQFFHPMGSGKRCLETVMMTGILPYTLRAPGGKSKRFYQRYTILDETFSSHYGFTEPEVRRLIDSTPLLENRNTLIDSMIQWYGGFDCGPQTMLNPWSVRSCLHDGGRIDNHLKIGTRGLDAHLREIITDEKFAEYMDTFMEYEEVEVDEEFSASNYTQVVFPLLLHNGLLTVRPSTDDWFSYKVPNNETLCVLKEEVIRHQLKIMGIDHQLLPVTFKNAAALLTQENVDKFEKEIQKVLADYCKATSLPDERTFYWLMKALLIPLSDLYDIISQRKPDLGICGQRVIPKNVTTDLFEPVFLLEYKYVKLNGTEPKKEVHRRLISASYDAIDRIKTRNYTDNIPVAERAVYYVGVAATTDKELRVAYECFSRGRLISAFPKRRPQNATADV